MLIQARPHFHVPFTSLVTSLSRPLSRPFHVPSYVPVTSAVMSLSRPQLRPCHVRCHVPFTSPATSLPHPCHVLCHVLCHVPGHASVTPLRLSSSHLSRSSASGFSANSEFAGHGSHVRARRAAPLCLHGGSGRAGPVRQAGPRAFDCRPGPARLTGDRPGPLDCRPAAAAAAFRSRCLRPSVSRPLPGHLSRSRPRSRPWSRPWSRPLARPCRIHPRKKLDAFGAPG